MASERFERIVLHAGMHKTGTTSIQDSCYRHRQWLLERGFVYPGFHFQDRNFANHSDPLAAALAAHTSMYGVARRLHLKSDRGEVAQVFRRQLDELVKAPAGHTLVLSAEGVCEFDAKNMAALRSYLERHAREVQVVAYVRSPESALASMLQQRCRSGQRDRIRLLPGLVRRRFERLSAGFPGVHTFNFHQAVDHPGGIVAHFLEFLGLAADDIAGLDLVTSNERVSMEAYRLMHAMNETYPAGDEEAQHGVERKYNDMAPLHGLPGQPFHIEGILNAEQQAKLEADSAWLAGQLDMQFPPVENPHVGQLWQPETLDKLAGAINRLESAPLRRVAQQFLCDEAGRLAASDNALAAVLAFIARSINTADDPGRELILDKLGADYFKYAALQMERGSHDAALLLMLLARELRPGAEFIEERIRHYRQRRGSH